MGYFVWGLIFAAYLPVWRFVLHSKKKIEKKTRENWINDTHLVSPKRRWRTSSRILDRSETTSSYFVNTRRDGSKKNVQWHDLHGSQLYIERIWLISEEILSIHSKQRCYLSLQIRKTHNAYRPSQNVFLLRLHQRGFSKNKDDTFRSILH